MTLNITGDYKTRSDNWFQYVNYQGARYIFIATLYLKRLQLVMTGDTIKRNAFDIQLMIGILTRYYTTQSSRFADQWQRRELRRGVHWSANVMIMSRVSENIHAADVRADHFPQHRSFIRCLSLCKYNVSIWKLNFNDNLWRIRKHDWNCECNYIPQFIGIIYIRNFNRLISGWTNTQRWQDIDYVPQPLQEQQGSGKRR